jgi:hypothetical protein
VEVVDSAVKLLANSSIQTVSYQYARNKQLEVKNVPASNIADLQVRMAGLTSLTGVPVVATDLDKCHRLNNKNNVILEFKTRDMRDAVLRGRKNLKNEEKNIQALDLQNCFILESLAPEFARMDYVCRVLKKSGKIHSHGSSMGDSMWSRQKGAKECIGHITDLYNIFGNNVVDGLLFSKHYRPLLSENIHCSKSGLWYF